MAMFDPRDATARNLAVDITNLLRDYIAPALFQQARDHLYKHAYAAGARLTTEPLTPAGGVSNGTWQGPQATARDPGQSPGAAGHGRAPAVGNPLYGGLDLVGPAHYGYDVGRDYTVSTTVDPSKLSKAQSVQQLQQTLIGLRMDQIIQKALADHVFGAGPSPASAIGGLAALVAPPQPKAPALPKEFKAGEIRAWRAWKIVDVHSSQPRLRSLTMPTLWEPGKVMEGNPHKPTYSGNTPSSTGFEGVYAFKDRMEAEKALIDVLQSAFYYNHLNGKGIRNRTLYAIGEVDLWGYVVEHELGYRASHASVAALHDSSLLLDLKPGLLQRLRTLYCVPCAPAAPPEPEAPPKRDGGPRDLRPWVAMKQAPRAARRSVCDPKSWTGR